MTLLTTREALADAVEVTIGLGVAPVHDCTLCARGWACPIHVGEAVADALLASGILRDVSTLADDEALVDRVRRGIGWWDDRDPVGEFIDATLRALAAALADRSAS